MVELEGGVLGEIQFIRNKANLTTLAVIAPFLPQPSTSHYRLVNFIAAVRRSTKIIVRPVQDIVKKCVLVGMQDEDLIYTCIIPNFYESD